MEATISGSAALAHLDFLALAHEGELPFPVAGLMAHPARKARAIPKTLVFASWRMTRRLSEKRISQMLIDLNQARREK